MIATHNLPTLADKQPKKFVINSEGLNFCVVSVHEIYPKTANNQSSQPLKLIKLKSPVSTIKLDGEWSSYSSKWTQQLK